MVLVAAPPCRVSGSAWDKAKQCERSFWLGKILRTKDDRIWLPDLEAVLDWQAVWEAGENRYGGKATWWVQATPGVNYYRAEMPAKHLPGKTVRFESRDLQMRDDDGEPYFPRQEGAAVWMFAGNTTRALCMTQMHLQGTRVLIEVDDDYTRNPPVPGLSGWLATRDTTGQDRHSYEIHRRIVASKACDGVIVSTPRLWETYSQFGKPVYVCANSFALDDWNYEPEHQPAGVLRVGWAGSASHRYDIAEISPALDWASRQKDVEVVLLGQLELPIAHRNVPWTDDLAQYRRNVGELDVILCPLRSNPWADCKSDIKACEGALGLAVPVVSKTEPFRPWWAGDAPCLVAEKPKDWLRCLKSLVSDREETRRLAQEARQWVIANRDIRSGIEAWREAIA
jgi:hypothetical protein